MAVMPSGLTEFEFATDEKESTMTKKDFEAIADILRTVNNESLSGDISKYEIMPTLTARLSGYFKSQNPRFDSARFGAAVFKA